MDWKTFETLVSGVNVFDYLLLIILLLQRVKEITGIPPSTDVHLTVWPVKPLFLSICLSLIPFFLYLSGMHWHGFQTAALGFTRQSGRQNLKDS